MIKKMMDTTKIQTELAEMLHQFAEFMPGGFFCYDVDEEQEFLFISESMPRMFGYTMEEFQTKFHNRFPEMVCEEDRTRVMKEIDDQMQNGDSDYCMYRVEKADGSLKWIYDRGLMLTDKNGKRWFCVVIVDADELNAAEQQRMEHEQQLLNQLREKTDRDLLTGILNRYAAIELIEKAVRKYSGGTLLLLEINNFLQLNEEKGYSYGDQLLKDITLSMQQMVHPEEILARFGEDKFIIFMPGSYSQKNAKKRAEKISEVVREAVASDIENGGCRVGIAISEREDIDFDEMLRMAEKSMH